MKGYVIKYTKNIKETYYTITKGFGQQVFSSMRGVKTSLGWTAHYDNRYKNWEDAMKKRGIEVWEVDIIPKKKVL